MTSHEKPLLLIVEDDFENQKFLQFFLRKYFTIEVCDSADTFYQKMKEQKFDLILMDISLRGKKDGLQLTKEIRKSTEHSDMPIVGLSAHAFQKDKDNAYDAGVDLFITKPVQNDVLLDALFNTLHQKTGKNFNNFSTI
ncbi:MAG: response regulator [Melioribacter sp.]|nr:response regulator [Melioribacter sp.]